MVVNEPLTVGQPVTLETAHTYQVSYFGSPTFGTAVVSLRFRKSGRSVSYTLTTKQTAIDIDGTLFDQLVLVSVPSGDTVAIFDSVRIRLNNLETVFGVFGTNPGGNWFSGTFRDWQNAYLPKSVRSVVQYADIYNFAASVASGTALTDIMPGPLRLRDIFGSSPGGWLYYNLSISGSVGTAPASCYIGIRDYGVGSSAAAGNYFVRAIAGGYQVTGNIRIVGNNWFEFPYANGDSVSHIIQGELYMVNGGGQ